MGYMIGITGEPGTGKSTSLRNLPPEETAYFDCDGKGLNWKGWKNQYSVEKGNYFKLNEPDRVIKGLQAVATGDKFKNIHYVVIDTVNNLMVSDEMRRCREKG